MPRPAIIVDIDQEGRVTVTVQGVPGPACQAFSRDLEAAIGRTVHDEKTREYLQAATAPQTLRTQA